MKSFVAEHNAWNGDRNTTRMVTVIKFLVEPGYEAHDDYGTATLLGPRVVAVVQDNRSNELSTVPVVELRVDA